MKRKIEFGDKSREKISKGVQQLTDAVQATFGPKGRNVLIQKGDGKPFLTKDGVTVAQEVFLNDELENIGAQIVKEVSSNTAFEAGDGTTTSTILVNAIYQKGLLALEDGIDLNELKQEINKAVSETLEILKENSREIKDCDIVDIATISANGDIKIGEMISDAMTAVGRDGIVSVEYNAKTFDELEIVEGYEFGRGYLSPHFITNPERDRAELENPLILLVDGKISQLVHILPILEKVQKLQRPLLIIAEEVEGEALSSIVVNKMRGTLNVFAVKSPGFGIRKEDYLTEISLLTGAKIISSETGTALSGTEIGDLGQAESILITVGDTTIIKGKGDPEKIQKRKDILAKKIESVPDGEEKERYKGDFSRLNSSAAIIKVGSQSEFEMNEKKDRFDDAVAATKSAITEGIVIGGGGAYIKALAKLKYYGRGYEIMRFVLKAPISQILKNSGLDQEKINEVISKVLAYEDNIGFDAISLQYKDFFDSGIIDPLKVERVALENATSVACSLLTTEVSIF